MSAGRRTLASAAALLGLLAASANAAGPDPDVELIAASAAFDDLERRGNLLFEGPAKIEDDAERDAAMDIIRDTQQPHLNRLMQLRAQTLQGARARLQSLLLWDAELDPEGDAAEEGTYTHVRLLGALLRDLDGLLPAARA